METKLSLLAVLLLSAATAGAEERTLPEAVVNAGRERNEQAYEKLLEQTGWKEEVNQQDSDSYTPKGQPESHTINS